MDGLIIKKKWLDLIVSGKKTIEIRGSNTKKQNETIYLLESRTHRVVATAVISSAYPISYSNWADERDKHCVYITYADLRKRTASGGNNNCEASLVDVTNPTVSFKTTSGVIKAYGYAYETTKSQWGGSTNTTIYAFNGTNYYKPAYYGSPTATNITLGVSGGKLTGLPSGLSGGTLLVVRGI